jgi:dUTP pyrophosphatase
MQVKVKVLHEDAKLPTRGTSGAAGYDVYANETVKIVPGGIGKVAVGFAVEIPQGTELQVRSRSGLSSKGIFVINAPGTIDEDYRGPVGILVANFSTQTFVVEKGDKIAQLVLAPYYPMEFEIVDELSSTDRGVGGFGSTGVK